MSTQKAVEIRLSCLKAHFDHEMAIVQLKRYALDSFHTQEPSVSGELVLRFLWLDWERTLKPLLTTNRFPFEVVRTFSVDVMETLRKRRITVAEDDLATLFAINVILEDAGYDVTLSHCGRPLIEELTDVPDVFVIDNLMPDVKGIEICKHLRSRPSTKNTPVIMISASHNFKTHAIAEGVNECLEKPFQMQELLRLISKYTKPLEFIPES